MNKNRGNSRKSGGDPELSRRIKAILARNKAMKNGGATTKAQIAKSAGVSRTAAGKWVELGEIARENIAPLCSALKCSADELLGMRPLGAAAEPPFTLTELAEALEFAAKFEKMEKRTLTHREKAQVLLNVMHLELRPESG
jgi:hypothetical protein